MVSPADVSGKSFAAGIMLWRVVTWLLLLLAAMGCLQYVHHAQQVWAQLQATSASDVDALNALRGMLGWDVGYLIAATLLIIICAGCVLRQAWARPALGVAAVLLAVWALYTGLALLHQWQDFRSATSGVLAQSTPNTDADADALLARVRRSFLVALALKAIAIPVLLWLAWQLRQPAVRLQFRPRSR